MALSGRTLNVLLVENLCKTHLSDDEFCKSMMKYNHNKKSKKKASLDANDIAIYTQDIVVITRSDIELKQRDEAFETKACLEDYHIDNINDYIENKIDDDSPNRDEPIYVLLHEICDNIDDIQKLKGKNFEIKSFVYISDQEKETKQPKISDSDETEAKDETAAVEEKPKINISEKIIQHFMDEMKYEKYECLADMLLQKIDAWKITEQTKGDNIVYKEPKEISQALRTYIQNIENEWDVYDRNWSKIPTLSIPNIALKDINEYKIYNECMNNIQTPNVSSILGSMIAQIEHEQNESGAKHANTMQNNAEISGVYRFGDSVSQNDYLNQMSQTQIELNNEILNKCSEWFTHSLFAENEEMNKSAFASQTTARYTFSKLNPSLFDDALICKEFNEILSQPINDWIFREDLNKTELFQQIQNLSNNPFVKCHKKYLPCLDSVILSYSIDTPSAQFENTNISVFLSSKIGFREWIAFPKHLKQIRPNAFYESNQARFLYNNTVSICPSLQNHWFMGLSSFDSQPNHTQKKPYLWLQNHALNEQNCVVSISKNIESESVIFSAQFADNAQLSFTSKPVITTADTVTETEENTENSTEKAENDSEEKEAILITPQQSNKDEIICIALPNGIMIEYHCQSGALLMYYESVFKQYQTQTQNKSEESTNEEITKSEPKTSEENSETNEELETIDVCWNEQNDIFVVWRMIETDGVITMFYSNDSQRKLFPNSESWYKPALESEWIMVKSNGQIMIDTQVKNTINIATTTDYATNTKIVTREDNVLVFCHLNGDGFIQYPDSTHVFVKSNLSKEEWDLNQLSEWMQSMGVDQASSYQISNLSQNTIHKTAAKLKHDLTEIKFELKNDCKMPTVIVDKMNKNTQIRFYNGFNATFGHPNMSENVVSSIQHTSAGKFLIHSSEKETIQFIANSTDSEMFKIDINETNPFIAVNECKIALNGEYSSNDVNNDEISKTEVSHPRLFVVSRDGNGCEIFSKDTFSNFCQYLKKCEPNSQILEPKPLLSSDNSPVSHRFIIERFANNAPRQPINIPSVLCETLQTKVNGYRDKEAHRNCSVYRHILQTCEISTEDIETAQKDLLTFETWLESNENKLKLQNSAEITQISKDMLEQRNKLRLESEMSPTALKFALTAELAKNKLNALNLELQKSKDDCAENMTESEPITDSINKESEAQARVIKNVQKENEQKIIEQENIAYFQNEPCLRDYEINQHLLDVFSYFIQIWKSYEQNRERIIHTHNEENDKIFISTLSLLKSLCTRLRQIISVKTLDVQLKILSIDEELMRNIKANESVANNVHNLLCSVGFALSVKEHNGYVPQQSNIFIDAGICSLLAKLDEYHSKYKRYLFKISDKNINCIKSFEMDLKTKIISNDTHSHSHSCDNKVKKVTDVPFFPRSPSAYSVTENAVNAKPSFERCLSHCSCCPIDSPQRATKMDYLGRQRKHIVSMDDLANYPKPVSNKQLNAKYIFTEGEAQRKVRTTSTFTQSLTATDAFPNIVIQPSVFDFGDVLVGNVYRFAASVTNHGNNQARLNVSVNNTNDSSVHIKPYYRGGGIAPGITILLEIELYARESEEEYCNTLTIKTQKYIFNVEIKANVIEDTHINHCIVQQLINDDSNLSTTTNNGKRSRVSCLGKKY